MISNECLAEPDGSYLYVVKKTLKKELLSMNDTSEIIFNLQSKWDTLHDLDRALAIRTIHKSGTSFNDLAKALKCSPSLLRHLLKALQAPKADQLLARDGKLTTNQLVRCAKAAKISQETKEGEALARKRAQASIRGCKEICDWLTRERFPGSYGEQIIIEAQRELAIAEQNGKLPPGAAPAVMTVTEIIQRCRPAELKTDAILPIAWFGHWLALWAFYLMPDSSVRYRAIESALEKQFGK
jgi:lambda repressor-like predicted transcriptional regulator